MVRRRTCAVSNHGQRALRPILRDAAKTPLLRMRLQGPLNHGSPVADQSDVFNCPRFNGARFVMRFVMRSMLTATLILIARLPAEAQMTAPSTAGTKPKTVTTTPIRPGLQTPAGTANAMAQGERLALQSDLAWVGQYNGAITGEVSDRMAAAIKKFQKARGGKQTGGAKMSAGRSSPMPAPAFSSGFPASWCRSNRAMPTARNGVRRPAPFRW